MKPTEALALVQSLSDAFPAGKMTPSNVSAYATRMVPFPRDVVALAIEELIRTSEFLPPLAKLYSTIDALMDDEPSAESAWVEVNRMIRRYGVRGVPQPGGGYGPIEFSSGLIRQAVDVMGWGHLCGSDNEVADRAHFFKVFDRLKEEMKTARRREQIKSSGLTALQGPTTRVLTSQGVSDGGK